VGAAGDAINVILAAARDNFRLRRAQPIRLLAFLLGLVEDSYRMAKPRSA
jgi:hypothetical protein